VHWPIVTFQSHHPSGIHSHVNDLEIRTTDCCSDVSPTRISMKVNRAKDGEHGDISLSGPSGGCKLLSI
jgi:hypothetical protein